MKTLATMELSVRIRRSSRVCQVEGLFDVAPSERSARTWEIDLPLEVKQWCIGLIVGPSGCGKSTVLRALCGEPIPLQWSHDHAVVDDFPAAMSVKDVSQLLSSVGFSSPPSWLRPYRCLSTGEQFRVTVARTLAEATEEAVFDEFTSVVDRTVAQIGSAAIARTVRAREQRIVVATCHYDVEEWLQPDWIYEPHINRFQWRELQRRPVVEIKIRRCHRGHWRMFRQHHYLSSDLHRSARCFLATWREQPVAFTAVLPLIGFVNCWREHRTVCLPDYQGVGIGSAVSTAVASVAIAATCGRYRSVTTHPGFIGSRSRSEAWELVSAPATNTGHVRRRITGSDRGRPRLRLAATHEYIGQAYPDAATASAMWNERIG